MLSGIRKTEILDKEHGLLEPNVTFANSFTSRLIPVCLWGGLAVLCAGQTLDDTARLRALLTTPASTVTIAAGNYRCDGSFIEFGNKAVWATGAIFTDCRFWIISGPAEWHGGSLNQLVDTSLSPMFRIFASNVSVDGMNLDHPYGYTGFEIGGSKSNIAISNVKINKYTNSAMTIRTGSGITISNCIITGNSIGPIDDGIAIKGLTVPSVGDYGLSENITISNCSATHSFDLVSLDAGELGVAGTIRNVTVKDSAVDKVTFPIFMWMVAEGPNSLVENVTARNIQVTDSDGSRYNGIIYLLAENLATVNNVWLDNFNVLARSAPTYPRNPVNMRLLGSSKLNGFKVTNSKIIDKYSGAATGVTTPGGPSVLFMYYNLAGPATVNNVVLNNLQVDGTAQSAILTEGPISTFCVNNSSFKNIYTSASSGQLTSVQGNIDLTNTKFLDLSSSKTLYASGAITNRSLLCDYTAAVIQKMNESVAPNSATITWSTNEPTTSQVDYGLTNSYGKSTSLDGSFVTNHSVTITGLTTNTRYQYMVKSEDSSGNVATAARQFVTSK